MKLFEALKWSRTKRRWYFAAVANFILAITAEAVAKQYIGLSVRLIARRAVSSETSEEWLLRASWLGAVGACFAIGALGCWVMSWIRREPGLQGVLIILFATYVLLCLLMI